MKTNCKLFLLVITLVFFSCSQKSNLKFGMMSCYKMEGDEKEIAVDKLSLKQYDNEIRVANIQSFINKLTADDAGKKYFSFVLADLPDQIIAKIKSDSTINIVEEASKEAAETTYYFYKVKKKSGLLLVKILFKQPKLTNSIIVDAVFSNEKDWESFYTEREKFIAKLNCDNDKK